MTNAIFDKAHNKANALGLAKAAPLRYATSGNR